MNKDIRYVEGALQMERGHLADIAADVGTPFYVYSASTIQRRFAAFHAAFSDLDALICFALKANGNQAVLTLLAQEGAGADVARPRQSIETLIEKDRVPAWLSTAVRAK